MNMSNLKKQKQNEVIDTHHCRTQCRMLLRIEKQCIIALKSDTE